MPLEFAAPALEDRAFEFDLAQLHQGADRTEMTFAGLQAYSRFQPVYSFAHRRAIGVEALVGVSDAAGQGIGPDKLFAQARELHELVELDRACRALHVANYSAFCTGEGWLLLNVNPTVAVHGKRFGSFFPALLARHALPARRVVIEIVEARLAEEAGLEEAVAYYRELGCLVAIDDFGAGESNFNRIWRLKPDIVKIDREMIAAAGRDRTARRMLSGIVSLLHETGALVCVEGIETTEEALAAVEANADFMQGYLFARPSAGILPTQEIAPVFEGLRSDLARRGAAEHARQAAALETYERAFDGIAARLERGAAFPEAAQEFLALTAAERCFLLDGNGRQVGANLHSRREQESADLRFAPLADVAGANWGARHYFRRAVLQPGRIQKSRPYLSLSGPKTCITLSVSVWFAGARHVLCADLDATLVETGADD
jgi:EAL domain-containing protein (putative c-di-GMP-specific phosphodiesterase class I)